MSPYAVIATILAYFLAMFLVSWLSGRRSRNSDFFQGGRSQKWWVVAFAMIGSCMSGVTFVSVPGMVGTASFGYLQMCIGFFVGYLVIAFVLTPIFYRLNLVSIYGYLESRFGLSSYRTGAWFFFISKMLGASVRLFVVCLILQLLVFDPVGLPFFVNVLVCVGISLIYTFRGGVKTVIWTDNLKTFCMIAAVVLCIVSMSRELGLDIGGLTSAVTSSHMSRVFFFDDFNHPQFFWKQFLGGVFTVVAMTGLDQDLMQRTLASKNSGDAQKNLVISSLLQIVVIAMFLVLGVLLYAYASASGIPETGDKLFPAVATHGGIPSIVGIMFILGLVSCSFSAGGSALTALTTSFTVDIIGTEGKSEAQVSSVRKKIHIFMAILMVLTICVFNLINNTSAIDAVYKLASYTYGPILGMFAFGIFTRKPVRDRWVPLVAVAAPLLCLVLQLNSQRWFGGYRFSYELLLLNALLTFLGLLCLVRRKES
ncbi:MAG: sodium:solute symporter [Bacteroidales bacterium]|nr:sodium:solute symporter [Bacteroidales bacterium]